MTTTPAEKTRTPSAIPAQSAPDAAAPAPFKPTMTRDMLVVHAAFRR